MWRRNIEWIQHSICLEFVLRFGSKAVIPLTNCRFICTEFKTQIILQVRCQWHFIAHYNAVLIKVKPTNRKISPKKSQCITTKKDTIARKLPFWYLHLSASKSSMYVVWAHILINFYTRETWLINENNVCDEIRKIQVGGLVIFSG